MALQARLARAGVFCVVLALLAGMHTPTGAQEVSACAKQGQLPGQLGGDWAMYGKDLTNSRHQDEEFTFDSTWARILVPEWTFSSADAGGDGDFTGTPIVAGGCMFVGSNTGWVFGVNATTGELEWKTKLDAGEAAPLVGGIPSTVAVAGGHVYVNVNRTGSPYVAMLDQHDGSLVETRTVATSAGSSLYASPVPFGDLLFVGVSAPTSSGSGRFLLLDAGDLTVRADTSVILQSDVDAGFTGAGIWATPAIDTDAGYAYVGTGEPGDGEMEHEHANALIKIGVDPARDDFGQVVGSYKNNIYEVHPVVSSADPHFDFGASPNLFTTTDGTQLVGALQRAGVYHAVDTDSMDGVWTTVVGPTQILGNASSSAYDGSAIYVSVNPGLLYSLDPDSGLYNWVSASADAVRYQPLAVANGVAYTVDSTGFFDAFETGAGTPILKQPLALGAQTDAPVSLGGVAVARNRVYAAVGTSLGETGYVVAYNTLISRPF